MGEGKNKDFRILSNLRMNARETLANISKNTGMPISTVYDKIKRFEKDIVQKYTLLVNFNKIGYEVRVNFLLKADKQKKNELREHLKDNPKVNSVVAINNGYDFLIDAVFRNMLELQEFNEELERFSIKEKKEFFIIEEIKREAFLCDMDSQDKN